MQHCVNCLPSTYHNNRCVNVCVYLFTWLCAALDVFHPPVMTKEIGSISPPTLRRIKINV